MPPKVKVTKEEIIAAALEILRQKGMEAVNARAVAAALGCSTQPFSAITAAWAPCSTMSLPPATPNITAGSSSR